MSYLEAKEIDQEIKRKRPPTTGSNVQRPTHREELWRLNLAHLAAGALGDQGNQETMLRYWKTQETAGYPGASENVQYFTELVEKKSAQETNLREQFYKERFKQLMAMPNCNDCGRAPFNSCGFCQSIGSTVRINCPLWEPIEEAQQ